MIHFMSSLVFMFLAGPSALGESPAVLPTSPLAPIIAIDAGHTPSAPGTISACGKREVDYNDDIARALQNSLQGSGGYQVVLTRQYQREVITRANSRLSFIAGREPKESLLKRSDIANQAGAQLFVSLHHDSTDDKYQETDTQICDGRGGTKLNNAFKNSHKIGFNIFIYQGSLANQLRFAASKKLATLIGQRMIAAGLIPSDYHQKPFEDCTSCRAIDPENGVWNQDLAVLRNAKMPAILIEAQNISDPEFEKVADSPEFKEKLTRSIKDGIDDYESKLPRFRKLLF